MLPVMDFRNQAILLEKLTSTDVNKAIQRSLTKAAARHGLGLYIYAGEDLPESKKEEKAKEEDVNPPMKDDGKVEARKTLPKEAQTVDTGKMPWEV